MPCDTIRTISVELAVADQAILLDALTRLQFRPQVVGRDAVVIHHPRHGTLSITEGTLTCRTSILSQVSLETVAGEIKRAYATEVVRVGAKRFGFNFTEQTAGELTLRKRFG